MLGPVAVARNGHPVTIGGPRQVAVLARLLATPTQVVSMAQLVEAVWDGAAPSRPEVTVRSYVSNLRRAIEPGRAKGDRRSCIAHASAGYRLDVGGDRIDAVRFSEAVEAGRRLVAAGDVDEAVDTLGAALDLWRGEPFEGVVDTDAILAARSRLGEHRLLAIEALAEAQLARGDHEVVMGRLEPVLSDHPLRERLTELAMLALYRSGRQSEALARCRDLRARLVEALGIDPGPAVQTLEQRILTQDHSLLGAAPLPGQAPGRDPLSTGHPEALPGERPSDGVSAEPEHVPQQLAASEPPQRHRVPRVEGRAAHRALAAVATRQHGVLVAITGEPGSGKSDLAAELATSVADDMTVAVGRCRQGAADHPLGPWSQVWSQVLATLGPASGATPSTATARSTVADEIHEPDESDATVEALDEVAVVRALAARSEPTLVILEDLHWADPASVEVLTVVAEELADRPVAVVATWRHTEPTSVPLRAALRRLARIPTLTRVELGGLDPDAVLELGLQVGLSRAAAHRIHQRTAGNPLYVSELVEAARHGDGEPDAHPGATTATVQPMAELPTNLREAVRDRIEGLHPRAVEVLTDGALAERFTPELLAESSELDQVDVDQVLEAAAFGGVLVAAGRGGSVYRFVHPVVADALVQDRSGPRRARTHARLGRAMWRRRWPARRIARQFARSGSAGNAGLAARFALDAAGESTDLEVLAEVAAIVDGAVGDLAGDPDTMELEVACWCYLADWHHLAGRTVEAGVAVERGLAVARTADRADLVLTVGLAGLGSRAAGSALAGLDLVAPHPPMAATRRLRPEELSPSGRAVWRRRTAGGGIREPLGPSQPDDPIDPELAFAECLASIADRGVPRPAEVPVPPSLRARLSLLDHLERGDRSGAEMVVAAALAGQSDQGASLAWIEATALGLTLAGVLGQDDTARDRLDALLARARQLGLAHLAALEPLAVQLDWLELVRRRAFDLGQWVDAEGGLGPVLTDDAVQLELLVPPPLQARSSFDSGNQAEPAAAHPYPTHASGHLKRADRHEHLGTEPPPLRAARWAVGAVDAVCDTGASSVGQVPPSPEAAAQNMGADEALTLLVELGPRLVVGSGGAVVFGPGSYFGACGAARQGDTDLARRLLAEAEEHARALAAWPLLARIHERRARLDDHGDHSLARSARVEAIGWATGAHSAVRGTTPFQSFPNQVPAS